VQEEQYTLNMLTVGSFETSAGANSSEHFNLHLNAGIQGGAKAT